MTVSTARKHRRAPSLSPSSRRSPPPEDPVDIGKAVVGDQVIGQVVLENRGTGPLEVDSVANDQPEFEGLFPQGPFSTPKLVRVTSKILQISSVPRPSASRRMKAILC